MEDMVKGVYVSINHAVLRIVIQQTEGDPVVTKLDIRFSFIQDNRVWVQHHYFDLDVPDKGAEKFDLLQNAINYAAGTHRMKVAVMLECEEIGDETRYAENFKDMPYGRPATVDEVAPMVVFLASDHSSYISGTVVTIDAGIAWRN